METTLGVWRGIRHSRCGVLDGGVIRKAKRKRERIADAVVNMRSELVNTPDGPKLVLEVAKRAGYHIQFADDSQKCEYFVPVKWLQTVSVERAAQEIGMFGNQNSICKPTTPKWRQTVERLKELFPKYD